MKIPYPSTATELEKLWSDFGDIAIDENGHIESDFHIWKKGTDRMDIWNWFDEKSPTGLFDLMFDIP